MTLYFDKYYSFLLLFVIIGLSLCNFLLIHKYNIFVGDDGVLATIFSGKYYDNKLFSIICPEIDFHKLYYIVVGYAYFLYFDLINNIINYFNLEFRWINSGSLILFFLSIFFFYKTFNSKKKFFLIIILLTLEPFLVLSHSIRHDILIFLGNAILLYCLSLNDSKRKNLLEIFSIVLLTVHPGGLPLLIAYFIYHLILSNNLKIIYLSLSCVFIILLSSHMKGILNLETVSYILSNPASSLISINNIFFDLFDYFYNAKYKRHLIEILLPLLYLITIYDFNKFSKKLKILFFFPFIYLIGYIIILGYFNISYLKFFYFFFLVYLSLYFLEIKNKFNQLLLYASSSIYLIVFFGIFVVFINHNPWKYAEKNISSILENIESNKLISAPLYFSYLAPKINNEYLPISQLDAPGTDKCFNKYQSQNNKLDYVFVDTRSLNDTFYGTKIKNYLNDYTIVESIYIGRLGTLSLDKNGYLYFYKLN